MLRRLQNAYIFTVATARTGPPITGWQFGKELNEHQLWYIHPRANWVRKGQIVR